MEIKTSSACDQSTNTSESNIKLSKCVHLLKIWWFLTALMILFVFLVLETAAIFSCGDPAPFFPFDMFSKCYIAEDKCPNKNVTFWLYTR